MEDEEEGGGWSLTSRDHSKLSRLLRNEEESEMDATASGSSIAVELSDSVLVQDPDPDLMSFQCPAEKLDLPLSKKQRTDTETVSSHHQVQPLQPTADPAEKLDLPLSKKQQTDMEVVSSHHQVQPLQPTVDPSKITPEISPEMLSSQSQGGSGTSSQACVGEEICQQDSDVPALDTFPMLEKSSSDSQEVATFSDVPTECSRNFPDHFGPDYFVDYDTDGESSDEYFDAISDHNSFLDEEVELRDEELRFQEASLPAAEAGPHAPIYKGVDLTQGESMTAILSFAKSEHLSGAGLQRLLSLVDMHLPKPNNFLKTNAQLFKVLEGVEEPVVMHFFCNICYKMRKSSTDLCDTCTDDDKRVLYFITFPLAPQLKRMFARPDFVENLKYKQERVKKNCDNIEDILDGKIYKEAEKSFSISCCNVTLMWNADGMQVFTSNSYSLWPFYLVVVELGPKKRFLSENLLLGGVWGCTVKPHPNVFLLPIYKELKTIEKGIDILFHGAKNTTKVVARVICGTCDAPARATFLNMKQHSGFFSCPACLIKGEKEAKEPTVFPYEEDVRLRNPTEYREHVKLAVENRVIVMNNPRNEEKSCGIKGPTILSHIVPDIFTSTAADVMHCLYLGVVRQMLHLWFDDDKKDKNFSLFKKQKEASKRMRDLTPPHYLHRTPQSFDKLIYWKATELRSFLLYFSLIVMKDLLLPAYYAHLALLVKGVSLLNTSSISQEDLLLSSLLLNQFVANFSALYGSKTMSHNLHMLIHLPRYVEFLGPLWAVSCFEFEDINGRISAFLHGTRHVSMQIHRNMGIITKLPLLVNLLKEGECKKYCDNLLKKSWNLDIVEKICQGLYCVGPLRSLADFDYVKNALEKEILEPANVQLYSRLLKDGLLYVSYSYTKGKRVSSFVKYKKNNVVYYGNVDCFARVSCLCSGPCECKSEHVAIIKPKSVSVLEVTGLTLSHMFLHQCSDVCHDFSTFDVVYVSQLITVMFKIDGTDGLNLCEPLNEFELE